MSRLGRLMVAGLLVGLFLAPLGFASVQATPSSPRSGAPQLAPPLWAHANRYATTASSSTNWAGYAISTANNAVTDVKGSWIVPSFKGSCGGFYNFSEAAIWVGIDGWGSSTVEQVGTSIECLSILYVSSISYFAWYEFYPSAPVGISLTINPGDHMVGEVKYTSSLGFTVSLSDTTSGNSYSTSSAVSGNRSSAEWIAEAPSSTSGILPLVDFGLVHFSHSTAVISGHTHTIGGFSNLQVTMWNSASTAQKATPGPLNPAGGSFAVRWVSYGP